MASTTKRRFTDEFKREAMALWQTSGRMQTDAAAELGIMPTTIRRAATRYWLPQPIDFERQA